MKFFRPAASMFVIALAVLRLSAEEVEPIPTVVESDGRAEMVSTDKETTITFRDNVRVTGTGIRMTCDYLQVVVVRGGDPAATLGKIEKFRSMLATGNVRVIQSDREAACGRAEVLPDQDKIILSDRPVIVFHAEGARQSGKTITMYAGQRKVEIDEPVSTLPPIKDLGYDKDKKPAPEAPATPPATPAADATSTSDKKAEPPPAAAPKQP
jgi:hypothetical protein